MAVCLRNLRICSSFVFVARQNRKPSVLDHIIVTSEAIRFLKEVNGCSFSQLVTHHNYNSSLKMLDSLQILPDNATLKSNIHPVLNKRPPLLDSLNTTKIEYWRLEDNIMYCAKECEAYNEEVQKESDSNPGKPDAAQVHHVFKILSEDLPSLFVKTMNYKIYHPNMVFENNIRGTKTVGIFGYVKQITLLKTIGHIKFAYVKFDILKITAHPEDGTVRVRWRIKGVSNYKAFFSFLKPSKTFKIEDEEGWYDGFSIFYIQSDGLIHRHIVDKMIPDGEERIPSLRTHLATKMAFAVGVMIKDFSFASAKCDGVKKRKPQNLPQVVQPLNN